MEPRELTHYGPTGAYSAEDVTRQAPACRMAPIFAASRSLANPQGGSGCP